MPDIKLQVLLLAKASFALVFGSIFDVTLSK